MKLQRHAIATLAATLLGCVALTGCHEKGAFEKAGEKVDQAVDKAGDAVDKAVEKTEDAVDEVTKDQP